MISPNITKEHLFVWALAIGGGVVTGTALVTGSRVFWVPLLLLVFWGWVRFATKYSAEALIVIVVFSESLFFITDLGIRERLLSDIGIALMLPLIVLNFRKVWHHIAIVRSPYSTGILLFFCAIFISLYFGSHLKFGQPMTVGLIVARKYLLIVSYFFMVAVGARREDCYRFMKYLAWLGAVIAVLSIVEVTLGGGVIFSNYYAVGQERAGQLRVHVGTFLIVYSVFYSFTRYQYLPESSQQRLGYLLLLGLGLFVLGFIVMTRAVILGLLLTFLFWLTRKITSRKIMFFCATVCIIVTIILSGFGEVILSETFMGKIAEQTSTELGANKGNITIRKNSAQYYLDLMMQHTPLTGVGLFSNRNYPNNPVTKAEDLHHYYIIDTNGIATLVFFGLQGLLLLFFFIIKSLQDIFVALRCDESAEKYNFEILFFIFIYILVTPTLNNIIVERMLVYSGVFFYLLLLSRNKYLCSKEEKS